MPAPDIVIRGAREHNLRNVDLVLPRNQLICLTGVSGSGKSSLAFDTLYAEGQRRYVESLSSFARQFFGQMPKPDVDHISGLSPSISISQKSSGQNPRSTVGTITEIYDYLRVLFARVGQGHCPQCGRPITAQSRDQIIERILQLPERTPFLVLAPLVRAQKGEYRDLFEDLLKQGFARARVDGVVVQLSDDLKLDRQMRHRIEVVIDRLTAGPTVRARLAEAVELALRLGEGELIVALRRSRRPKRTNGRNRRSSPRLRRGAECQATSHVRNPPHRGPAGLAGRPRNLLCRHITPAPLRHQLRATQSAVVQLQQPAGNVQTMRRAGRNLQLRSRAVGPQSRFIVRPRRDRIGRPVAEHGALAAAHLSGRGRRRSNASMASRRARCWKRRGTISIRSCNNTGCNGTGNEHITFTWRSGASGTKYGGHFEGIIPQLLSRYRTSNSKMQRRQLEKYMRVIGCAACEGARLNPQARSVTVTTTPSRFRRQAAIDRLPEVCASAGQRRRRIFRRTATRRHAVAKSPKKR